MLDVKPFKNKPGIMVIELREEQEKTGSWLRECVIWTICTVAPLAYLAVLCYAMFSGHMTDMPRNLLYLHAAGLALAFALLVNSLFSRPRRKVEQYVIVSMNENTPGSSIQALLQTHDLAPITPERAGRYPDAGSVFWAATPRTPEVSTEKDQNQ